MQEPETNVTENKQDSSNGPCQNRYDVVIIGAGLSGLAAAVRCAHFGLKTCVLEHHHRIGGLNSWYRRGTWLLDTGLHAMTNYAPPSARGAPLNRLLRQLRLSWHDLELQPQRFSRIDFPGFSLQFGNGPDLLIDSIADTFPHDVDDFRRLVDRVREFDAFSLSPPRVRTRPALASIIKNPDLLEALLLPVMCYGSAEEHDMDFAQFGMLFRSIYLEGLARPRAGIRPLLNRLRRRTEEAGAEVVLGCAVAEIRAEEGTVAGVVLESGRFVSAKYVLSCAGIAETLRMCRPRPPEADQWPPGRITLCELAAVIDTSPAPLPEKASTVFWTRQNPPPFRCPAGALETNFGVLCLPANFGQPDESGAAHGSGRDTAWVRLSVLANPEFWIPVDEPGYRVRKTAGLESMLDVLDALLPGVRARIRFLDMFTPRTIQRYTRHINGALYGSPLKVRDGTTPVRRLVICGADQGFLGIVGALLSGVSMANYHVLRPE